MTEDKRPFSVEQFARVMKARGDSRSLKAIEKAIVRMINTGTFPGAYKTNPEAQTSPWNIPYDAGMRWLEDAS